jgi:hypothetical protein
MLIQANESQSRSHRDESKIKIYIKTQTLFDPKPLADLFSESIKRYKQFLRLSFPQVHENCRTEWNANHFPRSPGDFSKTFNIIQSCFVVVFVSRSMYEMLID